MEKIRIFLGELYMYAMSYVHSVEVQCERGGGSGIRRRRRL